MPNNKTAHTSNRGDPAVTGNSNVKSEHLAALRAQLAQKVCAMAPEWADEVERVIPDEGSDSVTGLLVEHSFKSGAVAAMAALSGGRAAWRRAWNTQLSGLRRDYRDLMAEYALMAKRGLLVEYDAQPRQAQAQAQAQAQPERRALRARLLARVRRGQG